MIRSMMGKKKLQLFTKRFFPAGNYTWVVPRGCKEVDVFLVGGVGGGSGDAGGGGYTKTFKSNNIGWKDGNSIPGVSGQTIPITVGRGGNGVVSGFAYDGGFSQFMSSTYRANGGKGGSQSSGGNGGSGGGPGNGGSDGGDGDLGEWTGDTAGKGQGHTTRDFGESFGKRNAGGGSGQGGKYLPGISDYNEGKGMDGEGGSNAGKGGGGGAYRGPSSIGGDGGDGTVLIRYWAYEE